MPRLYFPLCDKGHQFCSFSWLYDFFEVTLGLGMFNWLYASCFCQHTKKLLQNPWPQWQLIILSHSLHKGVSFVWDSLPYRIGRARDIVLVSLPIAYLASCTHHLAFVTVIPVIVSNTVVFIVQLANSIVVVVDKRKIIPLLLLLLSFCTHRCFRWSW